MEIQVQMKVRKWSDRVSEDAPFDIVMGCPNGTYHSKLAYISRNDAQKTIEDLAKGFPDSLKTFEFIREAGSTAYDDIEEAKA